MNKPATDLTIVDRHVPYGIRAWGCKTLRRIRGCPMLRCSKVVVAVTVTLLGYGAGGRSASAEEPLESVDSVNIVGFQQKALPAPGTVDLVAIPFAASSLHDVFGTHSFFGSATPGGADRLRLWDPGQQRYINVGVGPDGRFYRQTQQGTWVDPAEEYTAPVEEPSGFWIQSASGAPSGRQVTMVGDVVLDEELAYHFFEGVHIVTYPFSSSMPLQEMGFSESGATGSATPGGADRIRVWDRDSQSYSNFGLAPDGNWYRQTSSGTWVDPAQQATRIFEAGEAFFYFSQGTFTWIIANPYLSALED